MFKRSGLLTRPSTRAVPQVFHFVSRSQGLWRSFTGALAWDSPQFESEMTLRRFCMPSASHKTWSTRKVLWSSALIVFPGWSHPCLSCWPSIDVSFLVIFLNHEGYNLRYLPQETNYCAHTMSKWYSPSETTFKRGCSWPQALESQTFPDHVWILNFCHFLIFEGYNLPCLP